VLQSTGRKHDMNAALALAPLFNAPKISNDNFA
jgi:hypothetical protein